MARDKRAGRPSAAAPGGDASGGNGENGGGAGGSSVAPRKSIRPRPVDMHKPLSVARSDQVSAALLAARVCVCRCMFFSLRENGGGDGGGFSR